MPIPISESFFKYYIGLPKFLSSGILIYIQSVEFSYVIGCEIKIKSFVTT